MSTTTTNQQQQQQQQQLPPREVVAGYIKRREVAKALDSVMTVVFSSQPDDPEKCILEYLAKKNPHLISQLAAAQQQQQQQQQQNAQQHQTTTSSTTPLPQLLYRQDSAKLGEPAQGDGTAPRQPVPPTLDSRHASHGVIRRRTSNVGSSSVNNVNVNNNTNNTGITTPTSSPLSSNHQQQLGTPTQGHHNNIVVPQTNLQAEELLQWILDVTDPSYASTMRIHQGTTSPQAVAVVGGGNNNSINNNNNSTVTMMQITNSSSSTNTIMGDNYTVRVPPGLESHPLASRCRQLANRYYATSRALENAAIEIDAEGNEQPLMSSRHHSHHSSKKNMRATTATVASNSSPDNNSNTQSSSGSAGNDNNKEKTTITIIVQVV